MKEEMRRLGVLKKSGAVFLSAALLTGVLAVGAGAASTGAQVTAQISPDIAIVVDGTTRTFFNAAGSEVHPIVYNGTTYLPIRAIGELMGKNVNWDQNSLTITISGARTSGNVTGTLDAAAATQNVSAEIRPDFTIVVDGVTRTFTDVNGTRVYPLLYNGSTYLPIRAIGELMGKTVSWNGATETVTLAGAAAGNTAGGNLVTDADSFSGAAGNQTNNNQTQPVTPPTQQTTPPVQQITPPVQQQQTGSMISAETAKSKALEHAGVSASQATFIRAHLDWDDGRQVYDVEFFTPDYTEYDYEIDAYSGAVLSFDYDAEYALPQQNTNANNGSYIGLEKAKSIALAKVPGATAANVRAYLDYDDGRMEYNVDIFYNGMEYEFEIDAYSGNIISWDVESIYS